MSGNVLFDWGSHDSTGSSEHFHEVKKHQENYPNKNGFIQSDQEDLWRS